MEDKIYFMPGDVVTLKQEIPNKPIMVVVSKATSFLRSKDEKASHFKGMKCRWFATDLTLQEAIFNTKDLLKVT